MMKNVVKGALTLVAAAAVAQAGAVTVVVNQLDRSPAAAETVSWTPVGSFKATPHEYFATTDTSSTFLTYCVELRQAITALPNTYTTVAFSEPLGTRLAKLFQVAGFHSSTATPDAIDTAVERQALQLAVWNITLDTDNTLDSGDFKMLTDVNGARAQANAWLAAASASFTPYVQVTRLFSRTEQDLIIVVPEPSTYALMMAGLLGIGFVARRRQAR